MTDEKLIEESFKVHEDTPTWQDDPVARDAAIRWHMRGFNDARAVFEKAHAPNVSNRLETDILPDQMLVNAPTDDERDAMLESIQAGMAYYAREDIPEDGLTEAEQIADFLSDAGFRRSEVPEPSDENMGPAAGCAYCVGAGGYEDHDGEWVECSCQLPEPQREPTDAQVRAVWDALGPAITVAFEYEELRAALRTAYEVREEGR